MKVTNGSEDWRVLCEMASKEMDPGKLLDLITKINQALQESRQQPRYSVDASSAAYRLAAQSSRSPEHGC